MAFAKHKKNIRLIDSESKVQVLGNSVTITVKGKTVTIPREYVINNGKWWIRVHKDTAQDLGLM
jgi:hypothetical protein